MNIKHLSTLLLLSMTLLLTACQDSVSTENETSYGTIFYSSELGESDRIARDTIKFSVGENDVVFQSGYKVIGGEGSAGGRGTLYAAEYELLGSKQLPADEWAKALQNNVKISYVSQEDKSYKEKHKETIYEIDEFVLEGQSATFIAVKVEYDKHRQTYWVYIAIPASKIRAADDPKVISRFNELRKEQK